MDPDLMPSEELEARAHIMVGVGPPQTRAGQLMHEQWHAGKLTYGGVTECGSMGCGFLGRILAIEAEMHEIVITDQSENDE